MQIRSSKFARPALVLVLFAIGGIADFGGAVQGLSDAQRWIESRSVPVSALYVGGAIVVAIVLSTFAYAWHISRRHARNIDVIKGAEAPQNIRKLSLNRLSPRINVSELKAYTFRHALDGSEIHDLSKTEDYDQTPVDYNIDRLVDRWRSYRLGNWVCVREGKICGGIDMWPITEEGYEKLRSGNFGEDAHLEKSISDASSAATCHRRWYLGSISVDLGIRRRLLKRDAIIMMVASYIRQLLQSSQVEYPCSILALAWSDNGRNMLDKFNFTLVRKGEEFGDVYEAKFKSKLALAHFAAPYLAIERCVPPASIDA